MSKPLPHTPREAQAREARTALGEPAPFPMVTTLMDDEWKRRFDEMHPTVDVLPAAREGTLSPEERRNLAAKRRRLVDGLLRFGGERVCLPAWEADLDAILERGRLFSPEGLVRRRGRTGECHANTAMLWRRRPDADAAARALGARARDFRQPSRMSAMSGWEAFHDREVEEQAAQTSARPRVARLDARPSRTRDGATRL